MNLNSKLFAILARHIPALYDLIPRGPLKSLAGSRLEEVALNPQPLPPISALALGSAVAADFVQAAWTANRLGADMNRVMDDLDDWCPTVPAKLRLPPWWPPIPDPDPDPTWLTEFHIGFAARLSAVSLATKDHGLRETVDGAMKRSFDIVGAAKG